MNNIQKRLKETRKQKGFTQKKIADLLGVTQQTYQQIEAGSTQDMRVSTLIRLCEILNISADWLLEIGEYKKEPTQIINIFSRNSAAISNGDDK